MPRNRHGKREWKNKVSVTSSIPLDISLFLEITFFCESIWAKSLLSACTRISRKCSIIHIELGWKNLYFMQEYEHLMSDSLQAEKNWWEWPSSLVTMSLLSIKIGSSPLRLQCNDNIYILLQENENEEEKCILQFPKNC